MNPQTISQIGAFTKFSPVDGPDYLAIDATRCTGTDDPDARTTIEAAPGRSGALIFPALDDAWIMAICADLVVTSTGHSSEPGYLPAVEALLQEFKSAFNDLAAASGDLVHADGTLTVWKQSKIEPTWQTPWIKSITFGLVVDVLA